MAPGGQESGEAEKRILGAFVAGLADALPSSRAEELQLELEAVEPFEVGERDVAVRCLNAAVDGWRKGVGGAQRAGSIRDAEAAFEEWEFMGPIVVDARLDPVRDAVREALLVAAEALGPFPGGEPGAFREATERPAVAETVEPRPVDLRLIAARSGHALGLLAGMDSVDPSKILRAIAMDHR